MMLMSGRLGKFVNEIIGNINEEKQEKFLWEYWLHKDFERSWKAFRESLNDSSTNAAPTQNELKKTAIASANILKNFRPASGGEQNGAVQTVGDNSD